MKPKTTRETIYKASLLDSVAAANYLNISRTTLYKLRDEGKLPVVEHGGKKQYRVADLDKAKAHVGAYAGKRGRPTDFVRAFDKELQDVESAKQEELAHDILEGMGIDPNLPQHEAEALLRKQITVLASRNKFVTKLFALLASPSEATQLRAMGLIKDIVLPTRKEIKHNPGEEWEKTQQHMESIAASIREDMKAVFGPRPQLIEGEVVSEETHLPAIEVKE